MLSGWLNLKSQNLIYSEVKACKMDPNIEEIRMWLSEGQARGGGKWGMKPEKHPGFGTVLEHRHGAGGWKAKDKQGRGSIIRASCLEGQHTGSN